MNETGYKKAVGIYLRTELSTIKKKQNSPLQPIFEAFINSIEAKKISEKNNEKGIISIEIYLRRNLMSEQDENYDFVKIVITDDGIGFNDEEYERFITLRDNRKNFHNHGTGRVQYLHSFEKTEIHSVFKDNNSSTGYKERNITLSKSDEFLRNNAIIRLDSEGEVEGKNVKTSVTFIHVLDSKDEQFFCSISADEIKREIIRHYLAGFCENRASLPKITIKRIIDDKIENETSIVSEDIPSPNREESIEVHYSKLNENVIEKTSKKEVFNLKAFVLPQSELEKNSLNLTSKGEVAKAIKLENLLPTDQINNNRYLFLLSGEYIDIRDGDTRGEINIISEKEMKKRDENSLFNEEEILLEDLEEKANNKIISLFAEIKEKKEEKERSIDELKNMFLLNEKTIESLRRKINIDDSDDSILKKVYEADAKIIAEKDAQIKRHLKSLDELDTTDKDYQVKLNNKVNEFVKTIPIQNRTTLTQYVARRKLVLELFDKILAKEIKKLEDGGRIDEDLMHNLIFQQSSQDTENSDLWLINEEFIYFKGTSESKLGKLQFDGETLIKDSLTEEEENYRLKQNGDANQRRADILLFPKEGKCIIIELKAPEINISNHLNQINRYASLINNLSKDHFSFNTYYGYLIGENIDIDDIEDTDTDFKSAHSLDYIFRPYKRIAGKFGKKDGALYMEIIKFSTLLKRAKLRNQIFIDKITKNYSK